MNEYRIYEPLAGAWTITALVNNNTEAQTRSVLQIVAKSVLEKRKPKRRKPRARGMRNFRNMYWVE